MTEHKFTLDLIDKATERAIAEGHSLDDAALKKVEIGGEEYYVWFRPADEDRLYQVVEAIPENPEDSEQS